MFGRVNTVFFAAFGENYEICVFCICAYFFLWLELKKCLLLV